MYQLGTAQVPGGEGGGKQKHELVPGCFWSRSFTLGARARLWAESNAERATAAYREVSRELQLAGVTTGVCTCQDSPA